MSGQTYSDYKPSGVEWLGDIPTNWNTHRLKYCTTLINQKVDGSESELPYTGLEHIESWTGRRIAGNGESASDGQASRYEPGDVLFGKLRPYLAKALRTDKEGICTGELLVLRPKLVLQNYLFNYLVTRDFISIVDSSTYGVKMPRANWEFIGNLPMLVPPEDEQHSIATFLDRETARIDALIEKKQQQIELLQEKRVTLISEAVTKGLDKNAPMKNSDVEWIGEIPEHWCIKSIKRITRVKRGASPRPIDDPKYFDDNGEYYWVRISDVTASKMYFEGSEQKLSKIGDRLCVKLHPGDLFVSICASVGKPCITKTNCCIHDGFVNFPDLINSSVKYVYYIFESQLPYGGLGKLGTQLNLNTDTIGNIVIPYPGYGEQVAIADYLDNETARIDALIEKVNKSIALIREHRMALIYAAVTGKIDVRKEIV